MKNVLLTTLIIISLNVDALSQYSFDEAKYSFKEGETAYVAVSYHPKPGSDDEPGEIHIKLDFTKSKAGSSDYSLINENLKLNFKNAAPTQYISIKINEDEEIEKDETIYLNLYGPDDDLIGSCLIKIDEKSDSDDFFRGAIGGNVNFADKKLQVNSVYIDMSFKPHFPINLLGQKFLIYSPIRVFYNNGSGPQDAYGNINPLRTITIDTNIVVNGSKKVRYWSNEPVLSYTTETRNLAMNIPILVSWKIPLEAHVNLFFGYNFEFASISRRETNFKYVDDVFETDTVNTLKEVPMPEPIQVIGSDSIPRLIDRANVYYQDSKYVPAISSVNPPINFFQIYHSLVGGVTYVSSSFDCSLRYSIGKTTTFFETSTRRRSDVYGFRHNVQLVFLEKQVGIQLLFDVRIPQVDNGQMVGVPIYYVSFAKTLNFAGLKELFFPK